MLSYSIRDGMTLGFVKGTMSSDVSEAICRLQSCTAEIHHPLLLPILTLSYQLSPRQEQRQRNARDWLRRLELALAMRQQIDEGEGYFKNGALDIDAISRDLVQCQSQVLWAQPEAWQQILHRFKEAMEEFWAACAEKRKDSELERAHNTMLDRLCFYQDKLVGIKYYVDVTMQRLSIQHNAVSLPYFHSP